VEAPQVRFARSPDWLSIAYQAGDPSGLDIVFLPFISALDVMWEYATFRHVVDRLGRFGRLISLGYRGMGASDPVPLGGLPQEWNGSVARSRAWCSPMKRVPQPD